VVITVELIGSVIALDEALGVDNMRVQCELYSTISRRPFLH
jgi:hypothetical protein